MNPLDILAQHRDILLLAEAAGWLHDYRKCSDEQLRGAGLSRNQITQKFPCLSGAQVSIGGLTASILDFLKWDDSETRSQFNALGEYLVRCHRTAHFDKQEPVGGTQSYPGTKLSTPFGFEKRIPSNLTASLWKLPWQKLCEYSATERNELLLAVSELFSKTVADTRRPINEVDLWSWGLLVGSLFKASLAGALLAGKWPSAQDLRWRLLGIRINGLDYLLRVDRIPDLLARKETIEDGLNRVRQLLEVTYPLGTEVYRDENGSIYVVSDIPDLLSCTDSSGNTLRELILHEFKLGTVKNKSQLQINGEIIPNLELESRSWWGQDPNWPRSSSNEMPDISHFLSREAISTANADKIREYWENQESTDICTVCGLRPQGPSQKAAERNVCDICEERRADRSQEWAISQRDKTIWTDEVADTNGRLALIVGRFDLTHWLNGELLDTLLLIAPHDPENKNGKPVTSKTASFSRLRRIWETTCLFWQEVQEEILKHLTDDRRRLKIYLDSDPNLGPFHVYDLILGATALSVVWVPPRSGEAGYLLSADNLGYVARQLGAEPAIYNDSAAAAIFVEEHLQKTFVDSGRQPVLFNPDARTGKNKENLLTGHHIHQVEYQEDPYATVIPILAEPLAFMAIVPADKSLDIAHVIKKKYEREMGKVRDRLPLHLGIVYAIRRTPIRAILDAGRVMLERRTKAEQWAIKTIRTDRHSLEVRLETEHTGYQIQWCIPLQMGDGATKDRWYPYFLLEIEGDDRKADEQHRRAVKKIKCSLNDEQRGEYWIVHVADLYEGEKVYVWPSTLDFEFLDTTGRRFDIYYGENGRRPRRTRPYCLEDLDRLEELWKYMKRLSRTQRHQVVRTIEATREMWYGQDPEERSLSDEVFKQFVADTLAGANWPQDQPWSSIDNGWQEKLIQAGVLGELADLIELHMEILKE